MDGKRMWGHKLVRITGMAIGIFAWGLLAFAEAAAPAISQISPRGLQIAATTTITLDGSDLSPATQLLLPIPLTKQTIHPGATPQHVEIDVTLDNSAAAGIYDLRVVTPSGVSNPTAIGIDSLVQRALSPQTVILPAALSGSLGGGQAADTSFTLKKGEQITVEVEAKRLGAAIDPVLHLLDARNVPLAWAEGKGALGGDARLTFIAPADGMYHAQLHDALYQAGSPGFYRLKIGAFDYADLVFPSAIRRGSKATLEFASTSLPPGTKLELAMPADSESLPAPWPLGRPVSGFRPSAIASDVDEVVQAPQPAGALQKVTAPVGINGRLEAVSEDRYHVEVLPGAKLRLEVLASRIGSPLDGMLLVRDEQGHDLASNDDQPGTIDPGLDYTVPANLHAIVVALRDVTGRSGPDFVYHLAISQTDRPDFALTLDDDRHNIAPSGGGLMRVNANRLGYDGPIKLAFQGLLPSVKPMGDEIPAGASSALVWLPAGDSQPKPGAATSGLMHVTGTGQLGSAALVRAAMLPGRRPEEALQPWLRTDVAVALTVGPSFGVAWAEPSAAITLKPGVNMPLKLRAIRGAGTPAMPTTGPIRLSLVSTQTVPKKTIKENNQDKQVDAPERALRLDGMPSVAAGAIDGAVQLLVPADLAPAMYELAIRAEMLTVDGKNVLATTYTPVLHANVPKPPAPTPTPAPSPEQPLAIFEDQPEFAARLDQGAGKITLVTDDKFSGKAAVKVTPDQRFNAALPGLGMKIRQNPGPGEFRYLRFAWKKKGGQAICIQLNHDGAWGPLANIGTHSFRYHAGPGQCYGASLVVAPKAPDNWVVVTRDLFADFGEFTLTGLALSPMDGDYGLFDHIYLARQPSNFDLIKP